jgi:hypothetical protein
MQAVTLSEDTVQSIQLFEKSNLSLYSRIQCKLSHYLIILGKCPAIRRYQANCPAIRGYSANWPTIRGCEASCPLCQKTWHYIQPTWTNCLFSTEYGMNGRINVGSGIHFVMTIRLCLSHCARIRI